MLAVDLTVRAVEEHDLPACLALLRGRLAYPGDVLADLPKVWYRLLHDGAMTATLVETRRPGATSAIAAFGLSVFVTDAWAQAARLDEEPYLAARTIGLELAGRSPILRPAAVARSAGASGLHVLILHYGEARELDRDTRMAVRYRMLQAFIEAHRGYRIEEVIQEFWDEIDPEYVASGWGRVVTDYASYFGRRGEAMPPRGRGPRLVGITRAEALAKPGAIAGPLFVYVPSRLSLTRAEQALLGRALLGWTDVELARGLGLSLPTIKSRWRAIYDRVGRLAPDVIREAACADNPRSARGQEKRRGLLEYLRRHPEELRAGVAPKR